MEEHLNLSDIEFERQFASCELNPSIFSHEAHLRLAWIQIKNHGLEEAIENIERQLQNFVKHVGAEGKYHRTVTVAAIKMVNHFMKVSNSDSFHAFITKNPKLKSGFKDLINAHYRADIFNSEKAKTEFIEPDLLPFD